MIIVDTHVHLYPAYDIAAALKLCAKRLHDLAPDAVPMACLTERQDCHIYKQLQQDGIASSEHIIGMESLEDGQSMLFRFGDGVPPLFVIPGRQIATNERIELHCLGKDARIPDGEPAVHTARRILEIDATAVLPWGIGKWLFGRRKVINKLLETFSPKELMLGDSAMRPWFWPTPTPMANATQNGYKVLAGSDPLPHEKNGDWIGKYATLMSHAFDQVHPQRSLISALKESKPTLIGTRPGIIDFPKRMRG
jgi:hypothetical protein